MYLEEVLEVAIGLVMMWLFVSIAVMQLQEWTASILGMRAKDLEMAVVRLLTDEQARDFYKHPLVQGLYRDSLWWKKAILAPVNWVRKLFKLAPLVPEERPSYIAPDRFARTVLDIVSQAGHPFWSFWKTLQDLQSEVAKQKDDHLHEDWLNLRQIAANLLHEQPTLRAHALDSLRAAVAEFRERHGEQYPEWCAALEKAAADSVARVQTFLVRGDESAVTLEMIRGGVETLQQYSPQFSTVMLAILQDVENFAGDTGNQILAVKSAVEQWFNEAMDRLSGWYKRKMQLLAFVFGLLLAIFLNIDSVGIARHLWQQPIVRQTLAAYATTYATETAATPDAQVIPPQETIQTLQQQLDVLQIPVGWQLQAFDTDNRSCALISFGSDRIFGIPGRDENGQPICARIANLPRSTDEWVLKIIGFLVTGGAAAQGAPFWFDILKRLVNIRGTGTKPEETGAVG